MSLCPLVPSRLGSAETSLYHAVSRLCREAQRVLSPPKKYFPKKLAQVKKRITFAPALKEACSGRLWEMGDKVALKKYLKKI